MDIERIEQLISGAIEPQTKQDEIFLVSYKHGLEGQRVVDLMELMIGDMEQFTLDEVWCFIFGYGTGQRDALDSEDDLLQAQKGGNIH